MSTGSAPSRYTVMKLHWVLPAMVSVTLAAEPAHVALLPSVVSSPLSALLPAFHLPQLYSMPVMFLPSGAVTVSVPEYMRRRGVEDQMRLALLLLGSLADTVTVMPSTGVLVVASVKSPSPLSLLDVPASVGNSSA